MEGPSQPALEALGISKSFGGVAALDAVDFEVAQGEVHALLGENGAGKSTLVNIIFGLYQADLGEVRRAGEVMNLTGPRDAIARQIGMVHQHFALVPRLTVAENVLPGSSLFKKLKNDRDNNFIPKPKSKTNKY